jgi:AcrR family transcriptional regulator
VNLPREPRWERRPEERPREILDAAFEVFSEKGYRATRLEEVAERAGATKGAIYHYFDGKEDLLVRTVEDRMRSVFSDLTRVLDEPGRSPAMYLEAGLRRAWDFWLSEEFGRMFRLMFAEVRAEHPALFEAWLTAGPLQGWGVIQQLIEAGKGAGEFRADADSAVAARFITCGLAFHAVLQNHVGAGIVPPMEADRVFQATFDILLRGLR